MDTSKQSYKDREFAEQKLISRLVRISKGCYGFTTPEMLNYLENNYSIKIRDQYELSRLCSYDIMLDNKQKPSYNFKLEDQEKWTIFIEREREILSPKLHSEGSFGHSKYKFNYESANQLIESAKDAGMCIFFNTYIDMNDWYNPLIQMHLCIQKSIEQQNNFNSIHKCHNLKNDPSNRGAAIDTCTANPPAYKHYRILLLPYNSVTLSSYIKNNINFKEILSFSCLMHRALSIHLGILTSTDLAVIIKQHLTFFKDEKNLRNLGLESLIGTKLEDYAFNDLDNKILENLLKMGKVPNTHYEIGLDFISVKRTTIEDTKNLIWTAHNSDENGLTYQPVTDPGSESIKNEFTNLIFNSVTEETMATRNDFNFLDPLHRFYVDQDRKFRKFLDKYNAFMITDLR